MPLKTTGDLSADLSSQSGKSNPLNNMHEYAIIACMSKLTIEGSVSSSDAVRRHAYEKYVLEALRRKEKLISINVGDVHREMGLSNRVPLVCAALGSKKFLKEHGLRIVSKNGPPSGQSTTVTYLYEMVPSQPESRSDDEMWASLRGIGEDVYASFGGGEEYLRHERANFYAPGQDPLKRKP
jgi:hypothetical protein